MEELAVYLEANKPSALASLAKDGVMEAFLHSEEYQELQRSLQGEGMQMNASDVRFVVLLVYVCVCLD